MSIQETRHPRRCLRDRDNLGSRVFANTVRHDLSGAGGTVLEAAPAGCAGGAAQARLPCRQFIQRRSIAPAFLPVGGRVGLSVFQCDRDQPRMPFLLRFLLQQRRQGCLRLSSQDRCVGHGRNTFEKYAPYHVHRRQFHR